MSAPNHRLTALSLVASLLMKLLEEVPEWQGPTKVEFNRKLNELLSRLEDAELRIEAVYLGEIVAETVAEAALV
jgi:hypothetical protein